MLLNKGAKYDIKGLWHCVTLCYFGAQIEHNCS
jgi:hypothetical protein